MRLRPKHDSSRSADPNARWRRRFFLLGGGLAVLVCLVWLFSGSGSAPSAAQSAAAGSSMAPRAGDGVPPAAYGSAFPGYEPATATFGAPDASPTAPASPPKKPSASRSPAVSTSASPGGGPACAPGAIVLSLSTSQASYGQGTWPQFDVYAVSTAASPCQMAYGAGAVRVVVSTHGRVVWDSAACGAPAAKMVQFQLGVPQVLTVTWDRQAASPSGCAGSLSPGASGTFDAVATTAGRSSPVHPFELLG